MELRKISKKELKDILRKHEKFLRGYSDGERADLTKADLRYANLRRADLRRADLISVDLRYANLSYADLTRADLRHADLTNADLRHADLTNVDLMYANLTDENLSYADLTGADLTGADLRRADLTGADLTGAEFWNTNFSQVFGKSIISIQLDTSEQNRVINYIPEIDRVSAGCFHGTLEELKNRVKDTHLENEKIQKRYEKAIEFIEFLKKDYEND